MLRLLSRRILSYLGRRRSESELDEEIRIHLEMAIEENVARGMNQREARSTALRSFGNVELAKERYRDQRGLPFVDSLTQDVRISLRQLRKSPAFALTACLLLGLGVGAATLAFALTNALLLTPLPGDAPQERVALKPTVDGAPKNGDPSRLRDLQENLESLRAVAGYYGDNAMLTGLDEPRRASALRTFGPFLTVLGSEPASGRSFTAQEERGFGEAVVIVSHGFAERTLGGSEAALDRSVEIEGTSHRVIGVLPPRVYPSDVELFLPAPESSQNAARGGRYLRFVGRLADGASLDQAQAEVDRLMLALREQYPDTDEGVGAFVVPLRDAVTEDLRGPFLLLLAVSLSVLLLTCLNLAGLTFARALRRRRESAVRVALGAGTYRMTRLYLMESLVVAAAGGVIGWAIAASGAVLLADQAASLPLADGLKVDWRVALASLTMTAACGIVLGIAPAWHAARSDAGPALKEGRLAMGARQPAFRSVLLGAQIALSLVLLIATALLTQGFVETIRRPLGFEPEQVMAVKTRFSWGTPIEVIHNFNRQTLERLRAIPGVRAVAVADRLPLKGGSQSSPILIRGRELENALERVSVARRAVSEDYFNVLGIPLLAGEPLHRFAPVEPAGELTGPVAVNESFAHLFFGEENPVGSWISFSGSYGDRDDPPRWRPIVAVVGNVRQELTEEAPPPEAFLLYDETYWPDLSFVLATHGDSASLSAAVIDAIHEIAPRQVVDRVAPLEEEISSAGRGLRHNMWVMYGFSSLALILAAMGLYGLTASEVTQRVPELGMRVALGASPSEIARTTLRQTLLTTCLGSLVGILLSLFVTDLLRENLVAVSPLDPVAVFSAVLALVAVTTLAVLPSVGRATRIDPAKALRQE